LPVLICEAPYRLAMTVACVTRLTHKCTDQYTLVERIHAVILWLHKLQCAIVILCVQFQRTYCLVFYYKKIMGLNFCSVNSTNTLSKASTIVVYVTFEIGFETM
jgi:hypothetical protein